MHKAADFPDRKTYADFQKVEEKNVYDKNLGFLSIMYLINRERFDEAEKMTRKRLAYNPSNAIYQFTLGKILYISGDRTNAKDYLVSSILNRPRLFTLKDMAAFDNPFSNDIRMALLNEISKRPNDPVTSAKYGYLLYFMCYEAKAKGYLAYAVNKLPNLSTPWLLLGDEKKYRLLTDGAFNINKGEIHKNEKRQTLMELFSSMYDVRFQTWYGQKLE